jgi:hypothetical protein
MVSLRMLLFCKSVLTKILFHINSALIKIFMFYVCALRNVVYVCDKPTNALINMSRIIGLHQRVMVTSVTIIRVSYNKNTIL